LFENCPAVLPDDGVNDYRYKTSPGQNERKLSKSENLRLTAASHRAENLFPGQVNSYERQKNG